LFWYRSYKTEIFVFLGALLIRALYALVIQFVAGARGFLAFSDAEFFYYGAAKNLLMQHAFSIALQAPYYPDAYHTPLYPLFVAALLWLRLPLFGVVFVQDALAALTVVLIYRLAKRISGSASVALVAAVIAALEPMSIYWSGLLMSDVFFTFLMVLSFYSLERERWAASGILLGLATLVRPIGLFFLPAYLIYAGIRSYNTALKQFWQPLAVLLIAFAIVISPWAARNKIVFNTWSLTSGGWYDLYVESIGPFAKLEGIPLPYVAASHFDQHDFTRFSFAYTPEFKAADMRVIHADEPGYVRFQIVRSLWSMFSNRYEYLMHIVLKGELPSLYSRLPGLVIDTILAVGELVWIAIYILFALAIFDRRSRAWWIFTLIIVGINAAISGGINPGGTDMSRYSLPFYPFFFAFAGIGWIKIRETFKRLG
jgi:4-amino-4-deoxy-L-arabinose transferase-like glycosyltransferase